MSRLIVVGERQATIIGKSLSAYANILRGKVDAITSVLSENGRRIDFGTEADIIALLKKTCFTELPYGASYDILDPRAPALAKIAYDMNQIISATIIHEKAGAQSKYKCPQAVSGMPFPEFVPVLNRENRRYRLTLDETQYNTIINALNLYEMLLCGNLHFICEILEMTGRKFDKEHAIKVLNIVKVELFPEPSFGAAQDIPEDAKIAERMRVQLITQRAA